ncbi:Hypothetical protein EAG7_01485 [Klebsiella aerogenes]|nr:Hypothetical protein EAG7_01485 [Klebsiella aerogenes]CCG29944.1 hypothetical protein [Klebsiella aerogenes EA1509E]
MRYASNGNVIKIKNSHSMSAIFKAQSFAFIYYNSGYLF